MTQSMQQAMSEIPPQTPLEGALNIANDDQAPWKETAVGEVVADLADTARIATTPLRKSAENTRDNIHENAPPWVFNNSARLIAGAHIAGEASYMFSSGQIRPPVRINGFNGSIDSANSKFVEKELEKRVSKLEAAGETVSAAMRSSLTKEIIENEKGLEKLYTGLGKFRGWDRSWQSIKETIGDQSNKRYGKWRFYSAMTGLTMFGLSAYFNPAPESKEEEARMKEKYETDKTGYFSERTLQMFRPDLHARQSMGLGFLTVGLFSGICGMTQRAIDKKTKGVVSSGYMKEVYAAALSAVSGAALVYSTEDQKGWQRLGQIMPARLIFTVPRSMEVWKDSKDIWYGGGVGMFQVMNLMSYMIGGTSEKSTARHTLFTPRDEEFYRKADDSWREKPLYEKYHEQADEIKATYARVNEAAEQAAEDHSEAAVVVRKAIEKAAPQAKPTEAKLAADHDADAPRRATSSPNTEVREAQVEERLKDATSQHVA